MSACHALIDARAPSDWHSGTFAVRDKQRADSQAALPDVRMLLRGKSRPTGLIHLPVGLLYGTRNETEGRPGQAKQLPLSACQQIYFTV